MPAGAFRFRQSTYLSFFIFFSIEVSDFIFQKLEVSIIFYFLIIFNSNFLVSNNLVIAKKIGILQQAKRFCFIVCKDYIFLKIYFNFVCMHVCLHVLCILWRPEQSTKVQQKQSYIVVSLCTGAWDQTKVLWNNSQWCTQLLIQPKILHSLIQKQLQVGLDHFQEAQFGTQLN